MLDLRARIWAHEAARGLRGKMDRKSLSRIISDLVREARLKFINMQIIGRRHDGTPRPVDVSLLIFLSVACMLSTSTKTLITAFLLWRIIAKESLHTEESDLS